VGSIIYVGKAKNLRHRVRSYFQGSRNSTFKTHAMTSQAFELDCVITDTEKEALILEGNLIKRYRPKYNVVLKDDKNYPYVKLSVGEEFPTLSLVRRVKKDGSLYFGPFASAQAVRETVKIVHAHFPLRRCQEKRFQFRDRPCIYCQIGQCSGPCSRAIDKENYQKIVEEARLFLEGKDRELITRLKEKMADCSKQLLFEAAARVRDQIEAVEKTLEKQKVASLGSIDRDVIASHREGRWMEVAVLFVRGGRVLGSKAFSLRNVDLPSEDALSSFLLQFYGDGAFIPREILLSMDVPDRVSLSGWLSEREGRKVGILVPRKGSKKELVKMAEQNAVSAFEEKQGQKEAMGEILAQVKEELRLKKEPLRVACYDISHLGGAFAVGSMVVFEEGIPLKEGYRHFRIKGSDRLDDCGRMYEVLSRQLKREKEAGNLPDLIVVDGGKGQLGVLLTVMEELGIDEVSAVGLAKGRSRGEPGRADEHVFLPHRKNPLLLPKNSETLRLLDRVRDESHRFAITYFREIKRRSDFHSVLSEVPGLGSVLSKRLLTHFGSMERIKKASLDDLQAVPGMKAKVAARLAAWLHAPDLSSPVSGSAEH
jgi:excinuclease ABC subunit C